MKKVKIGLIALSLGLFAVSCGNSTSETDTTATDSTTMNGSMDAGGTGTDMGTGTGTMDTMGTMNNGTGTDTTGNTNMPPQ